MKLYPDQLSQQLKQSVAPCYWVAGDEPLLVIETADQIRQAAKQQEYTNREVFYSDQAGFQWESFIADANSMSLFSDKRLLELRLNSTKLSAPARSMLADYVANPSPDAILLMISGKVDSVNTKWFKAIEAHCQFIPIWPIDLNQFPNWLKARLNAAGYQLENDAFQLAENYCQGNLLAAKQMLEKFKLLYPAGSLGLTEIEKTISDNSHYTIFDFADQLFANNIQQALKILLRLKDQGTEAILVLWALTREIRVLIKLLFKLNCGESFANACRALGVWQRKQPLLKTASTTVSYKKALHMLKFCRYIDNSIKGSEAGDPWQALSQLCLFYNGQLKSLAKLAL